MSITAMRQALEALEYEASRGNDDAYRIEREALRTAIAEAEKQEPVAWRYRGNLHEFDPSDWAEGPVTLLYTTPLRREWVGLTDDEIAVICGECAASAHRTDDISYARAIEAKLKEKNNG